MADDALVRRTDVVGFCVLLVDELHRSALLSLDWVEARFAAPAQAAQVCDGGGSPASGAMIPRYPHNVNVVISRGAFQFGGKPAAMGTSEQGREPLPTDEIHFHRPTYSERAA
ncbi:MAG: hypothetical protein Kow00123_22150 [Anaerolineales bacterium]